MGANVSNQLTESFTKTLNEAITNVANSVENQTAINSYSDQTVNIDLTRANLKNCPVTINQKAKSISAALADSNSKLNQDIATVVLNKVKEQISQTLDQVNSGLNLGQANVAIVKASLYTVAENNITTNVTNSIRNVVSVGTGTSQAVEFHARQLVCSRSPIAINQDTVIEAVAKNIADTTVQTLISNSAVNDIEKKIEQKVSQRNTGLSLGLGVYLFIVLLLAGGGYYFFRKAIQKTYVKILIIVIVLIIIAAGIIYYIYSINKPDLEKIK